MIVIVILMVLGSTVTQGKVTYPTLGEVWPKAFYEKKGSDVFSIDIEKFQFNEPKGSCNIITKAVQRCKKNIKILVDIAQKYKMPGEQSAKNNMLDKMEIELSNPCNDTDYPYFEMDESYNLTVSSTSQLRSATVWGLLRGLETFSQLFYLQNGYKDVLINATTIQDKPYYIHRGFLQDTARHFISVDSIMKLLDAMAMNKMNVFHWHIWDTQSCPFESQEYPEISKLGAYHPTLVYNKTAMEKISRHARDLGIRVMMEFDLPAHTSCLSKSHPEVMLGGIINPIKNETYALLSSVLKEAQDIFPDSVIHLGADEANYSPWSNNKEIKKFMDDNKMSEKDLVLYFFNRVRSALKKGTVTMMWGDIFSELGERVPKDIILEPWLSYSELTKFAEHGYKVVSAFYFYLDSISDSWQNFYGRDPRKHVNATLHLDQSIIGGEACNWGEMVDDSNMLSRAWPRASAIAEVLWSVTDGKVTDEVTSRIEEQSCRMVRRGIPAAPPSGAGFCVT